MNPCVSVISFLLIQFSSHTTNYLFLSYDYQQIFFTLRKKLIVIYNILAAPIIPASLPSLAHTILTSGENLYPKFCFLQYSVILLIK